MSDAKKLTLEVDLSSFYSAEDELKDEVQFAIIERVADKVFTMMEMRLVRKIEAIIDECADKLKDRIKGITLEEKKGG